MFKDFFEGDPAQLAPLTLAYIGDAVYELYTRLEVLGNGNIKVNELHKKVVQRVKAQTQSKLFQEITNDLDEIELAILKRGRNAKSKHNAKNAEVIDYRRSTGIEALIGYLYLKKDKKRLEDILQKVNDIIKE
ncbi:ribonuclease-3 family protein [Desulfonispora thiosulfatigenes DSM 11270]|uniref:Mini-ribonuclease 3 n=1 Tax=Desulfonispora thiosulfatigenes DSM 11270 TaxID=656914 RepID=A0A1W1UTG9_DESTI|nr:ribonuclease III domain-containing protein [Desulfonispora thiosulfatigenes]SMB84425.1 ribonuclease-3 family protein [Desulfonispora thiosulfatigenes DSM 11270]